MNIVKFLSFVCLSLFISVSGAYAHSTIYNSCAVPSVTPTGNVWYINPGAAFINNDGVSVGAGSTPDAAHGGVAVNGVIGTADGSREHPFNSLAAVFTGGKLTPVAGYSWPLLSTAPYDHYGMKVTLGNGIVASGVGINGQRKDYDWYPTNPIPTRINPGDTIILESGNYGSLGVGYYSVETKNVDAFGNIDFVTIKADKGANPVFYTLGVSASQGFNFDFHNVTITSKLGVGSVNQSSLIYITGNSTTPTSNIIVKNADVHTYADLDAATTDFNLNGAAAVNDTQYARLIARGTSSPMQAYLYDKMRQGVNIRGDDQLGGTLDNHCISVTGLHMSYVSTPVAISQSDFVLIRGNTFDHFGEDAIDFGLSSNISMDHNVIKDALNLGDGNHPDSHQNEISGTSGPYTNVVIDHELVLERTDPSNPWPQQLTFFQNTGNQLSGMRITYNVALISNCPGIALGSTTINSVIAFNTILGNGITPGAGCPAPHNGENKGSANNLWVGNLMNAYYQYCGNGTVWRNNYQISSRSAGISTRSATAYCNANGTQGFTSNDGSFNGITINGTDSPSFAVLHYDPPANGLTNDDDPNLVPVVGGPLYGTGQQVTAPNIGAEQQ